MMIEVPDDLAARLKAVETQMGKILELGLERWEADDAAGFGGLAEVMNVLAQLPEPEQILVLRPSPALQARIAALLEKSQATSLSAEEQAEWDRFERLEHLVRIAKARAAKKLAQRA